MDQQSDQQSQEQPESVPAGTDILPETPPVKKSPRKRATKTPAAEPTEPTGPAETTEPAEGIVLPELPENPPKARVRRSRAAAPAVEPVTEPEIAEDPAAAPEPARAKRTRKTPVKTARPADTSAGDTSAAAGASADDSAAPDEHSAATSANQGVQAEDEPIGQDSPFAVPDSPMSLLFQAPDLTAVPAAPAAPARQPAERQDAGESDDDGGARRKRSRRGRGRNQADNEDTQAGAAGADSDGGQAPGSEEADGGEQTDETGAGATNSRRRRRRRRGDQDIELTGGESDDPPNTVTRVRGPRQSTEAPSDKVTSVKGSTRLEAKRQRRRDSRDSGRRRQVITEAEFLARRESVDRQMMVRQSDDRIQIGVLEDGILAEHFVSKTQQDSLIGNVYVGKVQNVLPSMEAAFVDIGRGRNAVLYAGEVNWDAAGLDGQPRRIELALKSGDSVLVQVTKDPVGHKGARLTSQISLPGRYLVYVPGGSMTGISRKLPDVERNRLKRILKDRLPESAGVIVRTAAEGASEEELTHDINRLRAQWETIEGKASSTKTLAPELLYGEPDLTIKVVRDVFNEDFSKLVVSGEEAWDTIEAYVMYVAPDLVDRLEKWTQEEDIFAAAKIDEQIQKALDRKVFLPSGGSLVIDRTEAMTVVDVNTGKFTGSGGNLEETVTKNNLEAAEEVVRQLRLRDIGGIIVIDFIDMVLEANRDLVLRRLVECLGRDRTKHQVAEVTSLGLVQMTRKRMGTGLLEVFGEPCDHCGGLGYVTHEEPVEHRRHAVSPENHQQHLRQEKMSRSERKRNRGKGQSQDEEQTAPSEPAATDPERLAKAEAARAALANIAAATQAAHESHAHPESRTDAAAPEGAAVQATAPAGSDAKEAVLTINGETVTLPRATGARRAEAPQAQPQLTLDNLAAAFNRSAEQSSAPTHAATGSEPPAPAVAPPATAPAAASAPAAPRRRPRRVARSAQGAASASEIERDAESGPEGAGGTAHIARAEQPAARPSKAGAEPLVLGVGVPASEL